MRIGTAAYILLAILFASFSLTAAEDEPRERESVTELMEIQCGWKDETIHSQCRKVTYKDLPAEVRSTMRKLGCNVTAGNVYDYGSAVDLNEDGLDEYAFCCNEVLHGPCDMRIFGKIGRKWKEIGGSPGYDNEKISCFGFLILPSRTNEYHDMCIEGYFQRFSGGRYHLDK